jgi:hypothetical protein
MEPSNMGVVGEESDKASHKKARQIFQSMGVLTESLHIGVRALSPLIHWRYQKKQVASAPDQSSGCSQSIWVEPSPDIDDEDIHFLP